jgi:hypothetical protein
MAYEHPEYPGVMVQVGGQDKAVANAFYAPKKGDNLSIMSRAVYGDPTKWRLINSNPWNKRNLAYIAEGSTDCSKKRNHDGKGYISVCPEVSLQRKYQTVWIPPMDAPMTEPVATPQGPLVFMPIGGKMVIPNKTLVPTAVPKQLGLPGTIAQKEELPSYVYASGGTGAQASIPTPESSSLWMWIGIGIAVLAAGGILYATTRSGGKRR